MSKRKHILYAKITDNKFDWEKPYDIKNLPGKLKDYGRIKITFEKYKPMKSLKQLGYLHGGVFPFMEKELYEATGLDRKDWRRECKERFGLKEWDKSGVFEKLKSLADYTEPEMAFFITQIINWVFDFFQITVPEPTVIEEYI